MFPEWKGDLLVGALKFELLSRLDRDEKGAIKGEERILKGEFGRIRDVRVAPDGSIYLLTDESDGENHPADTRIRPDSTPLAAVNAIGRPLQIRGPDDRLISRDHHDAWPCQYFAACCRSHLGPRFCRAIQRHGQCRTIHVCCPALLARRPYRPAPRSPRSKGCPGKLTRSDYYGFFFIGVLLFSGAALQQIGMQTTSVTNAGFLTGLYVVMVPFLAVMLFWQWPHPVVWPCALTALAGIYLLSGGHLEGLTVGDWLIVACAVFWALQIIFINRIAMKSGRPIMLSLVQFIVCGVLGLIVDAWNGTH